MTNQMEPLGVAANRNVHLLVTSQGALQGFEWIALLPAPASKEG